MAEQPKKRRVKNPETFRERAVKANTQADQPKRAKVVRQKGRSALGRLFVPLRRLLSKVFNRQPFIFIGRIIFPTYFRDSWKELKKVTWPTMKQSYRLTFAVLVFSVVFGVLIAAVDWGLNRIFRDILLK